MILIFLKKDTNTKTTTKTVFRFSGQKLHSKRRKLNNNNTYGLKNVFLNHRKNHHENHHENRFMYRLADSRCSPGSYCSKKQVEIVRYGQSLAGYFFTSGRK
jgi:hypothetical protein